MIAALGSLLQTAATIAGISVALVALLVSLPEATVAVLRLPPVVIGAFGIGATFTLLTCILLLTRLWKAAEEHADPLFQFAVVLLYVGLVGLALGLVLFMRPEVGDAISALFGRSG